MVHHRDPAGILSVTHSAFGRRGRRFCRLARKRTTHGRHFRKWYHDQEILVTRFNTPLTPPSYGHCHRAGWQAAGGPASLCAGCAPSPSLWTCLNYVVRVSWFWCANFGNECYDLLAHERDHEMVYLQQGRFALQSMVVGLSPFDLFAARFLAICTRH